MIKLKSQLEIEKMREAGKITAGALEAAREVIKPGITTNQIDTVIRKYIESHGAKPSFLGYAGFPASACISVNDEVIHGIPDSRHLIDGDIVKVDVGAYYKGFHGDSARTFFCGEVSEKAKDIERVCRESFFAGIAKAVPGARLGDVSAAIQEYVESNGYSVVKEYVGHGIGEKLHESPDVPNYGKAGRGVRLSEGMTLAIEPMINAGDAGVYVLANEWTVVTRDHSLSAHYENTILVTANGPEILTKI
ncbi:MAG: type I methionyl aminopeptidase [Ruminococcaceae bacterium]|nr:type I methionyl aminopeptidase [Oscillospiraceae bacterium]